MKNKISFGINHMIQMDLHKSFMKYYKDYFRSVYCPIPNFELANETADLHPYFAESFSEDYYEEFIDFIRGLGLKLNFTLNSCNKNKLSAEQTDLLFKYIDKYKPDEICCSDKYFPILRSNYEAVYFRTILQGVTTPEMYNMIPPYNGYMLRTTYPFEYGLPQDKECRLMIDFACHMTCHASPCNGLVMHEMIEDYPYYVKIFGAEMDQLGGRVEKYLAHHLFMGRDIQLLESVYPSTDITYKYASRMHNVKDCKMSLDTLNYFAKAFNNYIEQSNETDFDGVTMLHMCNGCGVTEWMGDRCDWSKFDKDLFYEEKLNWWKKLIPDLDKY